VISTAYLRALRCVIATTALSLAASAASTPAQTLIPQYVRERWSADRGFPGGKVRAITETPDGFLWIGTEQGLVQFDGQSFRPASATKLAPTPIAPVLGLLTDALGEVWMRVGRDKLLRYSNGGLEDVLWLLHGEDAVTAMCAGKDGSILLAGLINGIVRYAGGRFVALVPINALPHSPITSLAEAPDGRLWLGTQDRGVFYVRDGRAVALNHGLPSLKIDSLLLVDDDVWIGTERGIVRWNGTAMTMEGVPPALRRERELAMLLDRQSSLWVATSAGVYRLAGKGKSSFDVVSRVESTLVTALFEDREGNIWAGQADAIERVRQSRFTTFGRSSGLRADGIGPVYVDSENRVWFALSDGGLYQLEGGVARRFIVPGVNEQDVVYSITGSGTGLWIGRMRGGLTHFTTSDAASGSAVSAETLTEKDGLAQNSVFAVHQARDGTVWAGTLNGGLSQYRAGKFKTFSTSNGLASNSISAITETSDGTIWVATSRGLSAWSQDRWRSYGIPDGLPSETVNCVLEDSAGTLWIGTTEGLAVVTEGKLRGISHAPGTLRGSVLGLADDRHGSLWIVTSTSVMQVPRQKLQDGNLADTDVREYGLADGLPGLGGVRRDRSVIADKGGRVWIATNRGLSVVDPAELKIQSLPTLTRIEGVSADGTSINLLDRVRIPPRSQRIAFAYAGLNLAAPERLRFRYKLDGFDRDWSEPTTQLETVYTNLAPGPYRFHVSASDGEGRWTGSESTIDFVVDPTFWQTLWFRLTLALTLLVGAIGVYRLRLHQVSRRLNIRFEERLAERTRLAQDLHDTLLQGLLSAAMQLHIADERLPADSPAKALVGRVLELMNAVSNEGRNVVRGLRAPNQNSDDLELAFSRIRQEIPVSEQVDFRIVVEGRPRGLHPAIRDQVYRIGREALVNAFRHSAADLVEVKLRYESSRLLLLFSDNGKGITPEMLRAGRDGHWGLSGMRERAERIGARLKVSSRASAGTEIELLIPDHIAFVSPTARRLRWIPGFKRNREVPEGSKNGRRDAK
jgi:ligand-binding sensor domain-containing protein/signal transduction histidine kinase